MGAVTSTFIAGVELAKERPGHAHRLGHPAAGHPPGQALRGPHPADQGFRAPGRASDLVFGGWDLFPDDMYEAALKAASSTRPSSSRSRRSWRPSSPMPAVFDPAYIKNLKATHFKKAKTKMGPGPAGHRRHRGL